MTQDKQDGGDLPLHDEAKARAKWRGGEPRLAAGPDDVAAPASEAEEPAETTDPDRQQRRGGDGPGGFPPPD